MDQTQKQIDNQIVFFHVPKCGGMTVQKIIKKANKNASVAVDLHETMMEEYSDSALQQFGILTGHLGYRILERLNEPVKITFLRDPVDRALSMYYFWKYNLNTPDTLQQTSRGIESFVRSSAPAVRMELDNGITWQFFKDRSIDTREIYKDMPMNEILDQAVKNIQTMDYLGFYEFFKADVREMCRKFHWSVPFFLPKENITVKRKTVEEISDTTIDAIRETVYCDIQLYNRIMEMRKEKNH